MSEGNFDKEKFQKFSNDNKLPIKQSIIKSIKDETIFNSDMIREIFKIDDGDFQLITNSQLTKNYLVLAEKTEKLPFTINNKRLRSTVQN